MPPRRSGLEIRESERGTGMVILSPVFLGEERSSLPRAGPSGMLLGTVTSSASASNSPIVNPETGIQTFPDLYAIPGVRHGFVLRHAALDVTGERDEVLERLWPHFEDSLERVVGGNAEGKIWFAEQVHGGELAVVRGAPAAPGLPGAVPEVDGLLTADPGVTLGILVADCCAVYLVDPTRGAIGLVHSGKKGTEAGIVGRAAERMVLEFGSDPADLVVQLSPCIRPPAYEVDIASAILGQCRDAGVPAEAIHDCGICTAQEPDRYYSYRREQGKTGRMLALLSFFPEATSSP